MAEIFLAVEHGTAGLERTVVVKRILPHLAVHDSFVDMFLNEARLIARLNHPNVVQIYELGEADNGFYIAMEYVAGSSLRDLMRKAALEKTDVPIDVAVSLVLQSLAGAHAAHDLKDPNGAYLGLVHRDISPHNLMVTQDGHVKLLDFGIAKATEAAIDNTRTGALKGKVHYMSPEQCRQEPLDRRSDLFAFGIVLWELVTARRLFKRESELMSMQAIVSGDIWDPRKFRKDLPDPIADVILRALATDKDNRFSTAEEMRRALQQAAEGCGLKVGSDVIAPFVQRLLGEQHKRFENDVAEAIARAAARSLDDDDEATVVETGGPHSLEKEGEPIRQEGSYPSLPGAENTPHTAGDVRRVSTLTHTLPTEGGRPKSAAPLIAASLMVFMAFAGLTLAAWWFFGRGPTVEGDPIRFGFAPIVDPKVLLSDVEDLRVELERKTKRPIVFDVAEDYAALSNGVIDGTYHFGSLPPYTFVLTQEQAPDVELIAIKLIQGSSGSDAVLFAREDSGVHRIAQLRGKTICYPDLKSTTGYMLPRAAIREAGIDPDLELSPRITGNHLQTLRDLNTGRCDVGGTYSGAYVSAQAAGVAVSRLRQVAITGRSPQDAIVASPKASDADKALVKKALLAFDARKDLGRAVVGEVERVSGYAPPNPGEFASIKRAHEVEKAAAPTAPPPK